VNAPREEQVADSSHAKQHVWLAYVLPLALFLAIGSLEPTRHQPGGPRIGLAIPYAAYPLVYGLKILATLLAIAWAWPEYRKYPRRVAPLAIGVGLVGVVVWVALARLRLESRLLELLGLERLRDMAARSGFNPLTELADRPLLAWSTLGLRLFGMVVVIAIAEEFFLRGFVMRLAIDENWRQVPFGRVTVASAIAGTLVPMFMHPGELLAAAAWFSLVTWLMARTRSVWDCILAHALTNLGLALYVLATGHWELM